MLTRQNKETLEHKKQKLMNGRFKMYDRENVWGERWQIMSKESEIPTRFALSRMTPFLPSKNNSIQFIQDY